jgi:hypothetical protein
MVAENVYVDDFEGKGYLIIRGAQAKGGHDLFLGDPAPDLFMRWIDDRDLEIWREGVLSDTPEPDMIGDVHIVRRSYVFPYNSADTYLRPGISAATIAVPASDVSAIFDQHSTKTGGFCVLSIETAPNPSYDTAKAEISVGISTTCKNKRDRPCAGIKTRFHLSNSRDGNRQTMLTSATISDIPSYNRLPEGAEGTMLRGQFLEQSAVALIEQLKQPSIEIEYSRDFFEQVLRYDVPLAASAKVIGEFKACFGNADLLWRL